GPLPDIAGHVVETVGVGGETSDPGDLPVPGVGQIRELAVPVVGQPLAGLLGVVSPGVGRVRQPSAGRDLPFVFAGQAEPGPVRVCRSVFERNVHDGMVLPAAQPRTWAAGVVPAGARGPRPPLLKVAEVDGPRGA